ncbi:beta/gamma crystallin domain-containing protein 1-like isoform X2 [Gadus chalcogrammus]|uniref:beta/gamma crystallin domain-containing protein 1-like isoform X2 n=1 Tax=Gadus chalcogrammus TaxID=1042646 RepID=UPI0024C4B858|nr:beta/gamma crystallin domain-containing protein 1-like isoform X2 [Gadus chalcogrammus]
MSESPEEEPSPGVLGRIGSWFSPWKSQIPRDLEIENATKASEQGPVPDTDAAKGGAARAEPVREPAGGGWQRKEGTGARSSYPERSCLSRDLSSSTKEDAARSARRDGPLWSTDWEPAEPGPKEEEFVDAREFLEGRRGQGWEREGGGHRGTPLTGDPSLEHKASPLTPRSRTRVLGAVGKLDAVHNPAQRNALNHSGKKLHVYLEEETSVINSGNNSGQEVVRVRLEKSFDVLAKTKSLDALYSPRSSGPERREIRNRFCLSAPVDLELTAPSDTHRESPGTESEETDSDRMGRKNTSRRKSRKLSQGDVEGNSQENTPSKACQALSGSPSASGGTLLTKAPGVETHLGRAAGNSASSQSLSEGGKNKTSPTAIHREIPLGKQPKGHLGTDTTSCTGTIVAAVDGEEDMDDKFKLERKTETAESKRKSIKVSRSEVKIFSKNVLVNADSQSGPRSGNVSENFHSGLSKPQDAVKDNSETEVLARKGNLGILEEEPKAVIAGRIADKISVFEGQRLGAVKKTFHTTRSADVSPIRAASRSLKKDDVDGGNRSKSEERLDDGRSSSAPPEKARTVKERARNIEACKSENKTPMSPKVAIRGMSLKTSSVSLRAVSKPSQLDIQDKQAVNEKTPTALISEIKHGVPDGTVEAVKLSGPEQLQADSGTIHPRELTERKDLLTTKNNIESDRPVPADSDEHANEINPEAKTSSKTGTRSKKRRSRDLTSPPNGTKSDGSNDKPLLTSSQQDKESASIGPCSPVRTLTDPGMVQSNKSLGKTAVEKHHATGSTQQVSGKTVQSPDKEPGSKDEGRDQLLKGQGGLLKSVTKYKGPDTDTSQRRTKQPSDVGRLPGKIDPVSDQKGEGVSKGNSKAVPSPTSSIVEQPLIEKPPAVEQGAPVAPVKSEKPPSQAESKAKASVKQQVAKTEAIDQSEDGCKQKNLQSKKNDTKNVPHVKDQARENVQEQQLPKQQQISVDKVTTKGTASNCRETTTDTEKSKAESGKKGGDKPSKNTLNSEPNQSEAMKKASPPKQSVDLPALVRELPTAKGGGVNERAAPADTHTVRVSDSDKGPVKPAKLQRTTNESKKDSAKVSNKETKAAVTAVELQSECLPVGKTETLADDSHTQEAGGLVAQEAFGSDLPVKTGTAVKHVPEKKQPLPNVKSDGREKPEKPKSVENIISPHTTLPKPISQDVAEKPTGNKSMTNSSSTTGVESSPKIMTDPSHAAQLNDSQKLHHTVNTVGSAAATQEVEQSPCDNKVTVPSVTNTKETETVDKRNLEQQVISSPVVMEDITLISQPVNNNPGSASCAPETAKQSAGKENVESGPGSPQRSPQTRLTLPRGLGAGDSSPQRDAPSSWLDVDFPKQRLRLPDQPPRLGYSSSESNLLDTAGELGDDDFVEKIKNLCAPFSMPPRKHSHLRPPQPPFAMPAIKEDRFEKTFDPDQFQFGLRKKTAKSGPSLLAKLQSNETKASLKPARASIADRCILLNSMDSRSRLRERSLAHEEKEEGEEERTTTSNEKEEKKEETKVRSRLEGSSILSSLSASSARGKRTGLEALPLSGVATSSVGPQNSLSPGASAPLLPSPTSPAPLAEVLGSHHPAALADSSGTQAGQALVGESAPLLPSFNDIKLPDYLEKYLPREGEAGREQVNPEKPGVVMSSAALEVATEMKKKPGLPVAGGMLPCLPATPAVPPPAQTKPAAPSRLPPTKPLPLPHGMPTADTGVPKGPHRRPGKMVLFEKAPFGGQAYEVFRDLKDATALQLSPVISVRVVRGCWILYESPGFRGRCVALEEGGLDLSNVWAPPDTGATPHKDAAMLIGSIRLAVCDYVLPHIDLFTDPEGHGRVTPYHDDTVEMGTFGIAQSTASIKVHSGVWLVFSDPGYQGMLAVLETGEYPFPESWGFPSPFIGSLRPLKMGAFKVEYPNEVKAVLYESPGFEGPSVEIESDLFCFEREEEEGGEEDKALTSTKLTSVGSLKIIGGLWVGYSQPGFEGRQHVLEEGEYLDWGDWGGGSEHFLSLRPVQADFISPHLKMFTDEDFGAHGAHIDLTVPVPSMELTGYGLRTKSVHVVDGVWVVFEEPDFCGEAYVLEKGLYGNPEDWGAMQPLVASVMPIVLDNLGNSAKFKVHLFSKEDFQGSEAVLEDSAEALQPGFSVASCRVLAGSWLAFEGAGFSSRMYVLEVGSYADRRAMGCVDTHANILSLQTAGFEFSLPSVTLFERAGLRGKRAMLTAGSVNLQLAGAFSRVQSVLVEGGMWVLYKEISYRGDQILLRPGEVPDWRGYSSWHNIGSLRPLVQKQVYIRLRNRGSGLLMGVTGELEDLKLMRVQETEETGGVEQVWVYQDGHLRCKLLEECCLSPSGTMTMAGSRLGLSPEPEGLQHLWSISPDGEIHHVGPAGLLLDVKGGHNYDKNQVILSTFDPNKPTQQWDVEIV